MVTLKDVAKLAGVSVATASRVISGKDVSEENKKKVLETVNQLGYQPNTIARSLIQGRTNMLAIVVPDIANPFFPAMAQGIEDVASTNDFTVILCNSDNEESNEKRIINTLRNRGVDGIILNPLGEENTTDFVSDLDIPMVFIDRRLDGIKGDVTSVIADNLKGGYLATQHLIHLDYSSIALITGPERVNTACERRDGYMQAMSEAGLEPQIAHVPFTFQGGYHAAKAIFEDPVQRKPRAIFAGSDLQAMGVLRAAQEMGLRIPEDLALVGYDDTMLASLVSPRLTSIAQPVYRMGMLAAEMLLKKIQGVDKAAQMQEIVLEPQLIIRESCGGM